MKILPQWSLLSFLHFYSSLILSFQINLIQISIIKLRQTRKMHPSFSTNKNTRFTQRPEVFNYSNAKSTDSDYEDLLNSPSSQIKRSRQQRERAKHLERQLNQTKYLSKSHQKSIQRQQQQFQDDIEDPQTQKAKLQFEEYLKQRQQMIQMQQEKHTTKIQSQKKSVQLSQMNSQHASENTLINDLPAIFSKKKQLQPSIIQYSQIKPTFVTFSKQDNIHEIIKGEEEKHQSSQKTEQLNFANNRNYTNSRVTMNATQFLHLLASQKKGQVAKKQIRASFKNSGRERVTLDIKSIAELMSNNYNKYQNLAQARKSINSQFISNSRNTQTIKKSRQSLELESTEFINRHIEGLIQRKKPRQQRIAHLKVLTQQMQAKIQKNTQLLKQIQEKIKQYKYFDMANNQQEQIFQLNLKNLEEILEPIHYFQYKYLIKIIKFQAGRQHNFLYTEFCLDNDIFCKIKRDKQSINADIRITYNNLLDQWPRQWIIFAKQRTQLLKLYFVYSLKNYNGYQIVKGLGKYYMKLKDFEYCISQIAHLFNLTQLQMDNNCQKLTFRLNLKPDFTFIVTIYLLRVLQDTYYDFYHLENQRQIHFPSNLHQHDFYEVLSLLIDLSNPES